LFPEMMILPEIRSSSTSSTSSIPLPPDSNQTIVRSTFLLFSV
jgi:hypothetical protein